MKPFFSHTRLIPSTSNEPSLTVLGRIPSIAPYPIGYRDSSQFNRKKKDWGWGRGMGPINFFVFYNEPAEEHLRGRRVHIAI